MKILLARSNTPSSWAVRIVTWSAWSHCGILTPEGTVIEAVIPRVREVPLADYLRQNGTVQAVNFPITLERIALAWAREQVGKPYDFLALVGFLLHRDWANPSRWFCSELVAAAFQDASEPLFRPGVLRRVTPQALWMLPKEDTEIPR